MSPVACGPGRRLARHEDDKGVGRPLVRGSEQAHGRKDVPLPVVVKRPRPDEASDVHDGVGAAHGVGQVGVRRQIAGHDLDGEIADPELTRVPASSNERLDSPPGVAQGAGDMAPHEAGGPGEKGATRHDPNCTDCAVPCGLDGGAEPISLVVGACAWAWGGPREL